MREKNKSDDFVINTSQRWASNRVTSDNFFTPETAILTAFSSFYCTSNSGPLSSSRFRRAAFFAPATSEPEIASTMQSDNSFNTPRSIPSWPRYPLTLTPEWPWQNRREWRNQRPFFTAELAWSQIRTWYRLQVLNFYLTQTILVLLARSWLFSPS